MVSLECNVVRRKNPAAVRSALIQAATAAIAREGFARLTVDGVAKAAGVTKGGLFHHFPSKQALIEGVLSEMLATGGRRIEMAMATDPEPHGSFTRAYLTGVLSERDPVETEMSRGLCIAMLGDPTLQSSWSEWMAAEVVRHAETDDNPRCALARLAADGIWLATLSSPNHSPQICPHVRAALIALTYPET